MTREVVCVCECVARWPNGVLNVIYHNYCNCEISMLGNQWHSSGMMVFLNVFEQFNIRYLQQLSPFHSRWKRSDFASSLLSIFCRVAKCQAPPNKREATAYRKNWEARPELRFNHFHIHENPPATNKYAI